MLYPRDLRCFRCVLSSLVCNTIFHHIESLCVLTVVTSSCRIPAYTFQAFDNRLLMLPTGIAGAAAAVLINMSHSSSENETSMRTRGKKTSFFTVEPVCSSFIRCSHLIRKINIDNRIFVVSSLLICECYRMQKQNQERKNI